MSPDRYRRLEGPLVACIAAHSLAVGLLLLLASDWSVSLGGWEQARPRFFVHQAGVFHVVVAVGYLAEYRRYGGVALLLLAKLAAVVFLLTETALGSAPWVVPASALGDGLMALAVFTVHRRAAG